MNEWEKAIKSYATLQDTLDQYSMPWLNMYEKISQIGDSQLGDLFQETNRLLSEKSRVCIVPSSFSITPIQKETKVVNNLQLSPSTESIVEYASYNTRTSDINKVNQEDLEYFRTRSIEIIHAIAQTDFEDGKENDLIELVENFMRRNKSVTYNWLCEIYSSNIENSNIVEGLLRIISYVTDRGDETILLPIVVAGLRSDNVSEQEAAIMVIEEWRTKECLEALMNTSFSTIIVEKYAHKVIAELKNELSYGN